MAYENVVQLQTLLERLADRLRSLLKRDAQNRADWIEIQEGVCLTLAEARGQFPADIEFGQWCSRNGFGDDLIDAPTRAVAITMGQEPRALRACLEATDRRSLRMIHTHDFPRFNSAVKPTRRRAPRQTKKLDRARDAVVQIKAEGKPVTRKSVVDVAQVASATADTAIAIEREGQDALLPDDMKKTMRKRYDAALRKARAEIREQLKAEVFKELDVFVRHVKERSDRADRILSNYKGHMSKDTFRKIKACLHPDHNTFKFAAEALQAFSDLEGVLVKPDDPVYSGPPLPTTAAELMARRKRR